MVATGVVFNKVTITWSPYLESTGSALPAFISRELSFASRGTKLEIAIPPAAGNSAEADKPVFYPMGRQGETIKLTGYLKTSANFALWRPIVQGNLLYVSSSEYEEMPSGTYWWVDANTTSRKGGMVAADALGLKTGFWNHELTIIESYRKGDQTVRT